MSDATTELDSVIEAVRADLLRRSQLGIKKYGVTLGQQTGFPLKGRLQHAYEEALDLANYLKWAITMLEAGVDFHAEHAAACGRKVDNMTKELRAVIKQLPVQDGELARLLTSVLEAANA